MLPLALFLASAAAFPTDLESRAGRKFHYGAIGDSYASGVSYSKASEYDSNKDGCHRLKQAYSVQLSKDWPQGLDHQEFTFGACSGAALVHMFARGQFEGLAPQMDQLHKDTRLVTMQAGGNDAGFYKVARDCIYHNEQGKAYGHEFPSEGACLEAIQGVESYLDNPASDLDPGANKDVDATVRDILRHPIAQNEGFKLYVLGYAHFFSVDSPGSDWCNDQTFSVNIKEWISGSGVKLSRELREKINDLTTRLNDHIRGVIRARNDPKVVFVSITQAFDGHRFCEEGATRWDQYRTDGNVWFWNAVLSAKSDKPGAEGAPLWVDPAVAQKEVDKTWNAAYNSTPPDQKALKSIDWSDLLNMEDGSSANAPVPATDSGSALRPFHPQTAGHAAIKDILKAQISKDFL